MFIPERLTLTSCSTFIGTVWRGVVVGARCCWSILVNLAVHVVVATSAIPWGVFVCLGDLIQPSRKCHDRGVRTLHRSTHVVFACMLQWCVMDGLVCFRKCVNCGVTRNLTPRKPGESSHMAPKRTIAVHYKGRFRKRRLMDGP